MSGCRLDEFGLRIVILEPYTGEDLDSTLFRLVANLIGRGK
jgi:hypothetical protein